MARFLADENFPLACVRVLRQLGHDVLTSVEAGVANQRLSDAQLLDCALKAHRTVLTLNRRDFIRLHRENPRHCGILACTRDEDFVALAERIDVAVRDAELLQGRLIRVTRPQEPG
ncbi:MAG: DUF5615 family PIN-like protein [Armatimonadota bacterium]